MKIGTKVIPKWGVAAIGAGAVAVVGGIAAAVILNIGGKNAFRNITVLDTLGSISVFREAINDTMEAYVDMNLESGDQVSVGPASELDLKLDDDKYVYVEENTKMYLQSEGDSENSKTVIYMSEGASLHRIDKKLNENSTYEIRTPNATMAIRGTVGWVKVTDRYHSEICLLEGTLTVFCNDPVEGQAKGQTITLEAGHKAEIGGDQNHSEIIMQNVGGKLLESAPIDFKEIPTQTLCNLKSISNTGRKMYIGDDLLQNTVPIDWNRNGLKDVFNDTKNVFIQKYRSSLQNQSDLPTQAATTGNIPEETTAAPENVTEAQTEPATTEPATTEAATTEAATTQAPTTQAATTEAATTETATTEEETEAPTEPATTEAATEEETSSSVTSYTVTFEYNGSTFATQTVTSGGTASKPKLQPTASGTWCTVDAEGSTQYNSYSFSTPVTGNITLTWIEIEE
ncbi:MAG: FecR domain-containing protein [Lachnospira sp.]